MKAGKGDTVSQTRLEPRWVYIDGVHRGTLLRVALTIQIFKTDA